MLANIPATQTLIEIKAPGGPEVLVPTTRPVTPAPAIRINRADCLQRMGRTNVFERMHLQSGEAFLVQGGSSGIGITRMPCSYRRCVTMFTEELPWPEGRDKGVGDGQGDLRLASSAGDARGELRQIVGADPEPGRAKDSIAMTFGISHCGPVRSCRRPPA